ncbi:MAG TPA: thioesterase family protein [Armatimonadaceae bacterium]|nr:thioesterase family protein [Armatimonadaceae bacterium]
MKKSVAEFEVYTFHIDFSGHVSNVVYVQWMEVARLKLLEAAGASVREMAERQGVIPVLTETRIRYRRPLFFGDRVRVEAWVSELKPASAWVEYRFYRAGDEGEDGEIVAAGRQKGVYLHRDTQRPYRLTREERALLEPYLAAAGEDDGAWGGGDAP